LQLSQSIRHTILALRHSPGVAAACISLLALGIAGVVTVFQPLYAVTVRPLPLPNAEQLFRLGGNTTFFNLYTRAFPQAELVSSVFAGLTAYAPASTEWKLPSSTRPKLVQTLRVTPAFFEVIGVAPRLGSGLSREPRDSNALLLSDRLWRESFGGRPDVLGTTVQIGNLTWFVVGVMPPGFDFPGDVDAWLMMTGGSSQGLEVVARLRPDTSLLQATAALHAMKLPSAVRQGEFAASGPLLQPLQLYMYGETRSTLLMLWMASGLFMLLACIGVVNVLLAHGVSRRRELAMQLALGSSRARLIRGLMLEAMVVSAAGAAAGVVISLLARQALLAWLPTSHSAGSIMPAIALAGGLAAIVATICGLVPAWHVTRVDVWSALAHPDGASERGRRRWGTLREMLAAVQIATALALLVATGLLARSLFEQINRPLGLQPSDIAAFSTRLPQSSEYNAARDTWRKQHNVTATNTPPALLERMLVDLAPELRAERTRNVLFYQQVAAQLQALPGVEAIGTLSPTPFTPQAESRVNSYRFVAPTTGRGAQDVMSIRGFASPNGFEVLGIPFRSGRAFTDDEVAAHRALEFAALGDAGNVAQNSVAIVNESLAQRLWPAADALGQTFRDTSAPLMIYQVVGVISDFHWTLDAPSSRPAVYLPFTGYDSGAAFVAKLARDASVEEFSTRADQTVSGLYSGHARVSAQSLDAVTSAAQRPVRAALTLIGGFSLLGAVVAGLAVYAASSLMVAGRRREIALRIALGASGTDISRLLLSRGARLFVGFPLGLFFGWLLARQLGHLLHQVGVADAGTYIGTSAFLLCVVVAAIFLSTRRAIPINLARALRRE